MKIHEFVFIPENKDKPIKVVYENAVRLTRIDDCTIEYTKRLTPMETERLFMDLFGTTDVGVVCCEDASEHAYYCPTCERFLDLTEIDSCMNTPNEIVDFCLQCNSKIINV